MLLFTNLYERLVFTSDIVHERNALMDSLSVRIRISPWQLLYRRMKKVLLDENMADKVLKEQFVCAEKSSGPIETCEHETSCMFVEEMEKGVPIAEIFNLLSGFVETVATAGKRCVRVAKDVAEEVADFAKCVTVLSSALQVVLMCASFTETGMEIKRVKVE